MTDPVLRTGAWLLSDLATVRPNGFRVFSCFHCGGGSSMGYKLAGFDVLGGVEIDPEMMTLYRRNLRPRHSFLMPVQEFKHIPDGELPPELFALDILDGSPPCSAFSIAGNREKDWQKEKMFREGQAEQVLDDLFFHFIDIADKLRPKIVVAENVIGLIQGKAKGYVKMIFQHFERIGYDVQLFRLSADRMGVPQKRERVFFLARRRDLGLPPIRLLFNEPPISFTQATAGLSHIPSNVLAPDTLANWHKCRQGGDFGEFLGRCWNQTRLHPDRPSCTVPSAPVLFHPTIPRTINKAEIFRLQSFPDDYSIGTQSHVRAFYVCGMSVPPFMMQRIAHQIHMQWLQQ